MDTVQKAIEYSRGNRDRFIRELSEFIRIESISTDEAYKPQVEHGAEWAAGHLRKLGIQ